MPASFAAASWATSTTAVGDLRKRCRLRRESRSVANTRCSSSTSASRSQRSALRTRISAPGACAGAWGRAWLWARVEDIVTAAAILAVLSHPRTPGEALNPFAAGRDQRDVRPGAAADQADARAASEQGANKSRRRQQAPHPIKKKPSIPRRPLSLGGSCPSEALVPRRLLSPGGSRLSEALVPRRLLPLGGSCPSEALASPLEFFTRPTPVLIDVGAPPSTPRCRSKRPARMSLSGRACFFARERATTGPCSASPSPSTTSS